ncbi:MAG: DUF2029 domain-containing protein [Planctomycetia bacterium]|nr:DUF2029 domain-containing protein [Planctomycetia bacterium]
MPHRARPSAIRLAGLAVVQWLLLIAIAILSRSFAFGRSFQERPILTVLALFAACFGLYLVSLVVALRSPADRSLVAWIVVAAVVFRATMLFSEPIQEGDFYRYVWDGAATANRVNPYRYAPRQVLAAESAAQHPADLARLVEVRDSSPSLAEILRRINFGELTTIYPPVSQTVFAVAHWFTPRAASVSARIVVLKAVLLVFDVLTMLILARLLKLAGKHPGWLIVYAWCPLVLKEFANSGHLDSIAVCFTTAAVGLAAGAGFEKRTTGRTLKSAIPAAAGALLALAVGAKLFAVVLAPLLVVFLLARRGPAAAALFCVTFLLVSAAVIVPLAFTQPAALPQTSNQGGAVPRAGAPPAFPAADSEPPASRSGLQAFFGHWEMNDFLFLVVVENLRPREARPDQPAAWFLVVPNAWRHAVVDNLAQFLKVDGAQAAFLIARLITATVFLMVAGALAWRSWRRPDVPVLLEAAFLTLAWLWLLSPTQNPWYWTWALPLLAFSRSRAWLALSGLTMLYYLRFWFQYHWQDVSILGSGYQGTLFFDFVVTWLEFAPWFLWLAAEFGCRAPRAFGAHRALLATTKLDPRT